MKKELSEVEQLSPLLIGLLLLVLLCFIWKPVADKPLNVKKPTSSIQADVWNVWQVGIYVIN
jgi:hypothetical protein